MVHVELLDESDFTRLRGKIIGPPGTPFDGRPMAGLLSNIYLP